MATINTTLPDDQGAALAQILNIKSYKDGNDLISQVGAAALLQANKRALIASIASETDPAKVASAYAPYAAAAAAKPAPGRPVPPIKKP